MLPEDNVVGELTRLVWSTVLGLEAEERATGDSFDRNYTGDTDITTAVDISGAWEGTVSITFPRPLAHRLAAAMLACNETDASVSDVRDAISELTNMVGGNVKGVLPGPCQLSLPRVEKSSLNQASESTTRKWFDCDGHPFSVTVAYKSTREGT